MDSWRLDWYGAWQVWSKSQLLQTTKSVNGAIPPRRSALTPGRTHLFQGRSIHQQRRKFGLMGLLKATVVKVQFQSPEWSKSM
jgi:hypothetical protein